MLRLIVWTSRSEFFFNERPPSWRLPAYRRQRVPISSSDVPYRSLSITVVGRQLDGASLVSLLLYDAFRDARGRARKPVKETELTPRLSPPVLPVRRRK